jgi:hypothetical protein
VAVVIDPVPVMVARSTVVTVERAEVRGARAEPVVPAEARIAAQYWTPKVMTVPASADGQASLAQSRTPLPKSWLEQ